MKKIIELLLSFMKIGLFTFGGGYAMISLIEEECVEKKKWITNEQLMKMTVIAESTPGPVAINCATFVGYQYGGVTGAIAATIGVVIPSFIVIYIIAMFLDDFLKIKVVAKAFKGVKMAVGIIIVGVGINMFKKMPKKIVSYIIAMFSFTIMLVSNFCKWNISSIALILICAVVGVMSFQIKRVSQMKSEDME